MATFTWVVDRNMSAKNTMDIATVKFGDGYSHRMAKSINPQLMSWNISFKNRTVEEIKAIESFLVEHSGVTSFSWSPPECPADIIYKVICGSWSTSLPIVGIQTLSCVFNRVYE